MKFRDLLFTARSQNSTAAALGDLVLRSFAGFTMAFSHGMGKIPPPEQLVQGVGGLGFPAPEIFAWAAAGAEFLGGLFLAIGLATRAAASFIAFTMIVAGFGAHSADPFQRKEMALLYLVIALHYLLSGAGRISIDRILGCDKKEG